jgi:hypothetical protein
VNIIIISDFIHPLKANVYGNVGRLVMERDGRGGELSEIDARTVARR